MVRKPITLETIPEFTLREEDELECLAGGMTGQIAVRRSVQLSHNAFAVYCNGELLCLWGYRYEDKAWTIANVWMLSTPAVDKYPREFARATQRSMLMLASHTLVLKVLVHTGYAKAIRWLEWLGFQRAEALNEHFITMKRTR